MHRLRRRDLAGDPTERRRLKSVHRPEIGTNERSLQRDPELHAASPRVEGLARQGKLEVLGDWSGHAEHVLQRAVVRGLVRSGGAKVAALLATELPGRDRFRIELARKKLGRGREADQREILLGRPSRLLGVCACGPCEGEEGSACDKRDSALDAARKELRSTETSSLHPVLLASLVIRPQQSSQDVTSRLVRS